MRYRIRIFTAILVCFGFLLTISLGLIVAVNFVNSAKVFSELLGQTLVRGISGMELRLKDHLDAAEHQAQFITAHILSHEYPISELDGLTDFAEGSLAAAPQITSVVIADAAGRFLGLGRTSSGSVESEWSDTADNQALVNLAGFMSQEKQASWGPPVFSEALSATIMNYRAPIWRDQAFLGFVITAISTQELSALANELSEPPRSRVFVLRGDDRILAHSYLVLQPGSVSREKPLPSIKDVLDPVIQRLDTASPSGIVMAESVDLAQIDVEGISYGVVTKLLEGYGDTPLTIGAYFNSSDVSELWGSILRTIFIGFGILTIGLVVMYALSHAISRPIRQTSEVAARVAELDLSNVESLKSSRFREIDDLSSSVNSMLVGLQSFARYMPRNLVRKLIRENRVGAGTEERWMTVMFTDIVDFTPTCEGMNPSEVAEFTNSHLTLVTRCVHAHGGTIDKYIGDAVMAFWGAPDRTENSALQALSAASDLRIALSQDNKKRASEDLPPVRVRIGIHHGQLIVGDIGSPERINYTVIGDVVNTAQRLEGLGKEVDSETESIVLVSSAVKEYAGDQFQFDGIGPIKLKGKHSSVEVYRLADRI
ncbi:adenylate/guanylate cyclase domain-containing protein [Ruegeria pomeroyi]|nr:adenylate/guanylate cyclase domain-containing protein [Ruegeria pomeroyi]MCE8534633.1 adenylate/guanylate cyclase domain-containing protein [Ruegeria pomeroyi]